VFNLFTSGDDNKLQSFEDSINDMAFLSETLKDDGFVIAKIPDYLKHVRFKETVGVRKFDAGYLSDEASRWLEVCVGELKARFESAFRYVKSVKSLVEIRDAVVEFESEIGAVGEGQQVLTGQQCGWGRICQVLFKKEVRVWSELIAPFYYAQSKVRIWNRTFFFW